MFNDKVLHGFGTSKSKTRPGEVGILSKHLQEKLEEIGMVCDVVMDNVPKVDSFPCINILDLTVVKYKR